MKGKTLGRKRKTLCIRSERRNSPNWPVECWVPSRGCIRWSDLTPADEAEAVEFADSNGDDAQAVSRWSDGLAGAVLANASALAEFPPGPRDKPSMYELFADVVADSGEIVPTREFRKGQRVFKHVSFAPEHRPR
jgi:hypothetical protein